MNNKCSKCEVEITDINKCECDACEKLEEENYCHDCCAENKKTEEIKAE